MYDVILVGGGVIGAALARELMRYRLSVCVLEKGNDVCSGASKANSGIIHGGFDPEPGTLKAELNVRGIPLLYQAARELSVSHRKNGSLVVAFSEEEERTLRALHDRGIRNGAPETQLLSGDDARKLEPALSPAVTLALSAPEAGIICPYGLTYAAMGNAMDNGAELFLNFEVLSITPGDAFTVRAADGRTVCGKFLVNCAGAFSDRIAELAGDGFFKIIPRAGEYLLLDKKEGKTVSHTIFQVPSANGKGVLVTPTADGNLLLGPTASPVEAPTDTQTTAQGLSYVRTLAQKSVPHIRMDAVITSFTGVRASVSSGDFIIRPSERIPRLIHAAAIDSPGLTSCFAIAAYTIGILEKCGLPLNENKAFSPYREDTHFFSKLSDEEKNAYIAAHPAYGQTVCRCENITKGEILDALRRNPKAQDVDGIKRRTRAGMGRCQGGFCLPGVMEILAGEQGVSLPEITKSGCGSYLTTGRR